MNTFKTFVDVLAVASGLVAVLHFLVPDSVLDWADRAVRKSQSWLEQHRYSAFRKRVQTGQCDRLIMRIAIVLILLNALLSILVKATAEAPSTQDVALSFVYETLIVAFYVFVFDRFGIPLVRWIFAGERNGPTVIKIVLVLGATALAGAAITSAIVLSTQMQVAQQGFDFLNPLEMAGPALMIATLAVFMAMGIVGTVLLLSLYFVVFMGAAWAMISAAAYVLNRSLKRKGLAVLLASVSTFLSAIMQFNSQ